MGPRKRADQKPYQEGPQRLTHALGSPEAVLDQSEGWQQDAHLFRTYAESFKGQRQLYWSNGLRAFLALGEEATDEEVAAVQEDNARMLAELGRSMAGHSPHQVRKHRPGHGREHPEALPVLLASILERSRRTTASPELSRVC